MAYYGGGRIQIGTTLLEFNPEPFFDMAIAGAKARFEAAGEFFVQHAKSNFVFAYPPHSSPWDFPHYKGEATMMRLVDAIDYTVIADGDNLELRAGIIADLPGRLNIYPHMLETGTRYMEPRPWLTISVDETWFEMENILTGWNA